MRAVFAVLSSVFLVAACGQVQAPIADAPPADAPPIDAPLADAPIDGQDGAIHISSPGLYQDYDSWITGFLPEIFQGQSYCHLATVNYLKALATGAMQPGITMTTVDDAPVRPK